MIRCRKPLRKRPSNRAPGGFLLVEVLIAAMVLVAVLSVLTQLYFRGGRLQAENRRYQVALEELTSQVDRLTALDEGPRSEALESLACSPTTQAALSSPELTARVLDDAHGRRLLLSLAWDRFGARRPVTLVGWLPQRIEVAGDNPAEGPTP